jgi:hypothetical protein
VGDASRHHVKFGAGVRLIRCAGKCEDSTEAADGTGIDDDSVFESHVRGRRARVAAPSATQGHATIAELPGRLTSRAVVAAPSLVC